MVGHITRSPGSTYRATLTISKPTGGIAASLFRQLEHVLQDPAAPPVERHDLAAQIRRSRTAVGVFTKYLEFSLSFPRRLPRTGLHSGEHHDACARAIALPIPDVRKVVGSIMSFWQACVANSRFEEYARVRHPPREASRAAPATRPARSLRAIAGAPL